MTSRKMGRGVNTFEIIQIVTEGEVQICVTPSMNGPASFYL